MKMGSGQCMPGRLTKAPWDVRSVGLTSLGSLEERSFRASPGRRLKHVTEALFLSLAPLGFPVHTRRVKVQILLIYKPGEKRISCLQHLYTRPREDSSWGSQSILCAIMKIP